MEAFLNFEWFLELLGTIAFAISGALIGMKSKLDLFGVIVLAVITATFGGLIRDILLGIFPPMSLRNPFYIIISIIVGLISFIIVYFQMETKVIKSQKTKVIYLWMDSIGLGIFTVVGVSQAYQLYPDARTSLFVLAGVLTGVGGGLIRDIIVNELPQIFRKDIYASASIIGAIICAICIRCRINISVWMILGTIMTTAIRLIAAYKNWELPKTK